MCPGRPEAHSAEIVELAIERIGARGDGVAQYRGEPVFVPFTVPGDRVRARLGARRRGGWEGYVADRLACGPERAAPPADISVPAAAVRCSTSMAHHTGGSSWRDWIPPLNGSGSVPTLSGRCGSSRRNGAGRGLELAGRAILVSPRGSGTVNGSAMI